MIAKKTSEKTALYSAVWLIILLLVVSPLFGEDSDDAADIPLTLSDIQSSDLSEAHLAPVLADVESDDAELDELENFDESNVFFATDLIPEEFTIDQDGIPESHLPRRIVWRGGEHALYYAVEIDQTIDGNHLDFIREYTTAYYLDFYIPEGVYRFRIMPYDILDRPAVGTPWMRFEVHQGTHADGRFLVINIDDYSSFDFQDVPTGLTFKMLEDEYAYSVQIGTLTDSEVIIPAVHNDWPVTRIAYEGFYVAPFARRHTFDNSSITSVWIPYSVTVIGHGAFYDWDGLRSIWIPESVNSIGHSAFSGCSSLTSLIIPSSITHISDWAFNGCSNLESIIVARGNTVYRSEGNCLIQRSDNTLILGSKASVIPNSVTRIGNTAFTGSGISRVRIPNSVTSIGEASFSACTSLREIVIPESVTSIGYVAFAFCTNLRRAVIPDSVKEIGSHVFFGCTSLERVRIGTIAPENFVSNQSFPGNLRAVYFGANGGAGTYTTRNPGNNARWVKVQATPEDYETDDDDD